jgi:hypothetical protein
MASTSAGSQTAKTCIKPDGLSRTNIYLGKRPAIWRRPSVSLSKRKVMEQFFEWRLWLARATSPIFADAIIAIVIAGVVTEFLRLVFS